MNGINFVIGILFLNFSLMRAQDACVTSFTSTDGYTVDIELTPVAIVAPSSCPWGYNFNVEIDYNITFSGSNIPSSLSTLQGHMECGSFTNNFFNLPNNGGSGTVTTGGNPWNGNTDCQTATVQSLNCNNIALQIQGSGISNQTVNCAVNTPLPISLLSMQAMRVSTSVIVRWKTAAEINNDYFLIEKSKDLATWNSIGRVSGAGNSREVREYEFVDTSAENIALYYRLIQVDYNGAQQIYGPMVVGNSDNTDREDFEFRIFPNPGNGNFTLHTGGELINRLELFDLRGRLIWERSEDHQSNSISLPVDIVEGSYILNVYFNDGMKSGLILIKR